MSGSEDGLNLKYFRLQNEQIVAGKENIYIYIYIYIHIKQSIVAHLRLAVISIAWRRSVAQEEGVDLNLNSTVDKIMACQFGIS